MPVLLIKLLCFLIRLIPIRLAGAIGAGLGRLAYMILGRHRKIALRNLDRVYPDKDQAWKIRTAHESFAELGRTIFEIPHVYLRSREFLLSRIEWDGLQEALDAIDDGKGVIFTSFHYSNWELGAMSLSMLDYPCSMIYRPLREKPKDLILKNWRQRFGHELHSRDESIRWIPKALKNGNGLALMIDQHLSNGIPVPFLGHPARSTVMPAVYARKYNTPVFAAVMHRKGNDFRFRGEFRRVDFPEKSDDADKDLVDFSATIFDSYREAIDARPELWLWIHRRWLYLDERESQAS